MLSLKGSHLAALSSFFQIYNLESNLDIFANRRERFVRPIDITSKLSIDSPELVNIRGSIIANTPKGTINDIAIRESDFWPLNVQTLYTYINRASWPAGYYQDVREKGSLSNEDKVLVDIILQHAIPSSYKYDNAAINKVSSTGAPFFIRDNPIIGEIAMLGLSVLTQQTCNYGSAFNNDPNINILLSCLEAGAMIFYSTARRYQVDKPEKDRFVWPVEGERVLSHKKWDHERDIKFLSSIKDDIRRLSKGQTVEGQEVINKMLSGYLFKARVRVPAAGNFLNKAGSSMFHPYLAHLKKNSLRIWKDGGPSEWIESLDLSNVNPKNISIVASDIEGMEQNYPPILLDYILRKVDKSLPEKMQYHNLGIAHSFVIASAATDSDAQRMGNLLFSGQLNSTSWIANPSGSITTSYVNNIAGLLTYAKEIEAVTSRYITAKEFLIDPSRFFPDFAAKINGDDRISRYPIRFKQAAEKYLSSKPVIAGFPHDIEKTAKFNGHLCSFINDHFTFVPTMDSYINKTYNPEYSYGYGVRGIKKFQNIGPHARRAFYAQNPYASVFFKMEDDYWERFTGNALLDHFPLSDEEKAIVAEASLPSLDVPNLLLLFAKPELADYDDRFKKMLENHPAMLDNYFLTIPSETIERALNGQYFFKDVENLMKRYQLLIKSKSQSHNREGKRV